MALRHCSWKREGLAHHAAEQDGGGDENGNTLQHIVVEHVSHDARLGLLSHGMQLPVALGLREEEERRKGWVRDREKGDRREGSDG